MGLFVVSQVAPMLMAQSANVYFGLGTATDSSNNQLIDTFGTGNPFATPKMTGTFADLGASVLFTKQFGVGADISWRTSRGNYAGLLYRPIFYDVDGVWAPISTKRFEPEIHAGLGAMHIGYSYNQTQCDQFAGCSTFNQGVETSSHFQVHLAAAARLYVTDKIFIRPAVDSHYVNNLFQFGSNWVPEYSLGVGYSFGRE
jgi:hypothetical protein